MRLTHLMTAYVDHRHRHYSDLFVVFVFPYQIVINIVITLQDAPKV